jgi:hypothetical protein
MSSHLVAMELNKVPGLIKKIDTGIPIGDTSIGTQHPPIILKDSFGMLVGAEACCCRGIVGTDVVLFVPHLGRAITSVV